VITRLLIINLYIKLQGPEDFDFSTRIIRPFHSVSSRALIAASASSSLSRDKNPNPRESPDLKY